MWLTRHCLQVEPSALLYTFSPKQLKKGKLSFKLLIIGDDIDEVPQRGKKRNAAQSGQLSTLCHSQHLRGPLDVVREIHGPFILSLIYADP
jgi:hypothetical protein